MLTSSSPSLRFSRRLLRLCLKISGTFLCTRKGLNRFAKRQPTGSFDISDFTSIPSGPAALSFFALLKSSLISRGENGLSSVQLSAGFAPGYELRSTSWGLPQTALGRWPLPEWGPGHICLELPSHQVQAMSGPFYLMDKDPVVSCRCQRFLDVLLRRFFVEGLALPPLLLRFLSLPTGSEKCSITLERSEE